MSLLKFYKNFLVSCLIFITPTGSCCANDRGLWKALKDGDAVVLIRHALAPGIGDPDQFTIGDCSSQRNLNEIGRDQARKIGLLFRANDVKKADLFSSEWCRCLETAQLLKLGVSKKLNLLNSFFQSYSRRDVQTREMQNWIINAKKINPTVLVTHQVNITALTEIYPSSGELVFIKIDPSRKVTVLGNIRTD